MLFVDMVRPREGDEVWFPQDSECGEFNDRNVLSSMRQLVCGLQQLLRLTGEGRDPLGGAERVSV